MQPNGLLPGPVANMTDNGPPVYKIGDRLLSASSLVGSLTLLV